VESIIITDPEDRSFPFSKKIFDNPYVWYHGTWSRCSSKIKIEGLVHGELPFDWELVATVFNANRAIGRGSALRNFLGANYPRELPRCDLFVSALERLAIQKLHTDERLAFVLTNLVNGADVRMVESGSGLCFALKTFERLMILSKVFWQELQCNESVEARVFGFVNHTHAAATKLFEDVVVRNGLANHD